MTDLCIFADVTCLELSSIALFPHHTPFLLSALTRLTLTNPDRLALKADSSAYARLLRPSVLPHLTHLMTHISYLSSTSPGPAPVLASFASLAPQLHFLTLREASPWLATVTTPDALRASAALDELYYWAPQAKSAGRLARAVALEELPRGLRILALDGAWAFLGVYLRLLKRAWEEERPGVTGLKMVRLPSVRQLALDGACEGDEALVERGLRSVAGVAEARGVRVEWTWWNEAAGEWAVDGSAGELPPPDF